MDGPKKPKPCPMCQGSVGLPPANKYFPFCSDRCKVLDLGNWLSGTYAIPAEEDDGADLEAPPATPGRGSTVH